MPGFLEELGRGVGVGGQGAGRRCQVLLVSLNLGDSNASIKNDTLGNVRLEMFIEGYLHQGRIQWSHCLLGNNIPEFQDRSI